MYNLRNKSSKDDTAAGTTKTSVDVLETCSQRLADEHVAIPFSEIRSVSEEYLLGAGIKLMTGRTEYSRILPSSWLGRRYRLAWVPKS